MTLQIDRRSLILAVGTTLMAGTARGAAERKRLALELVMRDITLSPGSRPIAAARFVPETPPRFIQGDSVDIVVTNRLPVAIFIFFRGLYGGAALEPILAREAIPPGGTATYPLTMSQAGTLICDARLGGGDVPLPILPFVVAERTQGTRRDDVLLIEEWKSAPNDSAAYTLNGASSASITAKAGEQLRLRFINGAQRTVLAIQLPGLDPRIIALDSHPSEAFPARDARFVLAPGTRVDAVVDIPSGGPFAIEVNNAERVVRVGEIAVSGTASAPAGQLAALPSSGLPDKIPLQGALRVDVTVDTAAAGGAPVSFRIKRGRTAVLALVNPTEKTIVVHVHGHPVRLLDRLDDGWKPFWLDTLAVPPQQTTRIAFLATHTGTYLLEFVSTNSSQSRTFRSYVVEA